MSSNLPLNKPLMTVVHCPSTAPNTSKTSNPKSLWKLPLPVNHFKLHVPTSLCCLFYSNSMKFAIQFYWNCKYVCNLTLEALCFLYKILIKCKFIVYVCSLSSFSFLSLALCSGKKILINFPAFFISRRTIWYVHTYFIYNHFATHPLHDSLQ